MKINKFNLLVSSLMIFTFVLLGVLLYMYGNVLSLVMGLALAVVLVGLASYNYPVMCFTYKHQYKYNRKIRVYGHLFDYYKCKHCNKIIGLDRWQIEDMPNRMAECDKSSVRIGLFEWLACSVDCLSDE